MAIHTHSGIVETVQYSLSHLTVTISSGIHVNGLSGKLFLSFGVVDDGNSTII